MLWLGYITGVIMVIKEQKIGEKNTRNDDGSESECLQPETFS